MEPTKHTDPQIVIKLTQQSQILTAKSAGEFDAAFDRFVGEVWVIINNDVAILITTIGKEQLQSDIILPVLIRQLLSELEQAEGEITHILLTPGQFQP